MLQCSCAALELAGFAYFCIDAACPCHLRHVGPDFAGGFETKVLEPGIASSYKGTVTVVLADLGSSQRSSGAGVAWAARNDHE